MSDLQIGLISLGVVLVAAVLIYNWWQDRRVRRSMQAQFPEGENDALMQDIGLRKEPGLWAPKTVARSVDETPEADPACEAVIDIAFGQAVSAASLHEAIQLVSSVGKKPVRIIAEREGGGHHETLHEGEQYLSLQLVVVIANRSGALTAIEWSHLWTFAQNLAERFDGVIEAPDQEIVLAQAQDLDTRCAEMDAQVGLILQLASPRAHDDVIEAASAVGFLPHARHMAWMAENGLPRFVMQFEQPVDAEEGEGVLRVDLVLDVPNSVPDDQAFSRMMAVGQDLAARLDAHLLDDQGRSLPDGAGQVIDKQISEMYDRLDQAGFLAGTERAARVFS
ncbi:hypothetical protein KVP09_00170 [Alcaligenaceae bacterium CGII-47]|nr:hypothetical protein [Alcaligenaceae bacterium CGII-47]